MRGVRKMAQITSVGGGESGTSLSPNRLNVKFQIGRRSGLLASLLALVYLIRGGDLLIQPSVQYLVIAWAVVYLGSLYVDTRLSPDALRDHDLLTVER